MFKRKKATGRGPGKRGRFRSGRPDELTPEQASTLERNLLWVFSYPRSGSTWLTRELLSHGTHCWDEPLIGQHLACFVGKGDSGANRRLVDLQRDRQDYFFCDAYRDTWRFHARTLILNRIHCQIQDLERPIVIKEPNGSMGADLIMACLPGSRMVVVLRDGRDVIDSLLDARAQGAWATDTSQAVSPDVRLAHIESEAYLWVERMTALLKLFAGHPGDLRYLLRYEHLRSNTRHELEKLYAFLGIDIPEDRLAKLVEKYTFENLPAKKKGKGKPRRSARPGAWKDNLTAEEQALLNEIMGDTLTVMGYE